MRPLRLLHARHQSLSGHALLCLTMLMPLSGCGDDGADLPWQARAAEDMRELPLLADVELIELTREQFSAQAEENANSISDAYLREFADTYGRMGFFDTELDLRPIFAGSSSDWVGAQYSPSTKRVTLVGDADDDTVVHEYVHAIQDQHFDIAAYDIYDTSDGFLARRAVVEGDATLAQYRFLMFQEQNANLDDINWAALIDSFRDYTLSLVLESAYPPIFLDYVSFTYSYGLEFSAYNLLNVSREMPETNRPSPHDWRLQDELYNERPIDTTRQILELDIDGVPDGPFSDIGLTRIPGEFQGRLSLVDWDSMGEWSTYLMLLPLQLDGTIAEPRNITSMWIADRVLFVEDDATSQIAAIWALSFEDEVSALAMADALHAIHGAEQPAEGFLSYAERGEMVWIEVRGSDLVMIRNLAEDLAPAMANAAFSGQPGTTVRQRPSMSHTLERVRRQHRGHQCRVPGQVPTQTIFDIGSRR